MNKVITVRLPSDTTQHLEEIASESGLNQSAVIRLILEDYIKFFNTNKNKNKHDE